MARSTPTALALAEKQHADALAHLADVRRQIRDLQIEGGGLNDQASAELYAAGREGRDPAGIDELRSRTVEIQEQITALGRVEEGAQARVQDAVNAIADARFHAMPGLVAAQLEAAGKLAQERAELEARAAELVNREQEHRSEWRVLCLACPGMGEPMFEADSLTPTRTPLDPWPPDAPFIAGEDAPAWWVQHIHASKRDAERGVITA